MITLQQLQMAFASFAEKEIVSKMNGWHKYVGYVSIILFKDRAEVLLEEFIQHPMVKALGVVTADNKIDAEKLYEAAHEAMKKEEKVTIAGITFDAEALDTFAQHINAVCKQTVIRVK